MNSRNVGNDLWALDNIFFTNFFTGRTNKLIRSKLLNTVYLGSRCKMGVSRLTNLGLEIIPCKFTIIRYSTWKMFWKIFSPKLIFFMLDHKFEEKTELHCTSVLVGIPYIYLWNAKPLVPCFHQSSHNVTPPSSQAIVDSNTFAGFFFELCDLFSDLLHFAAIRKTPTFPLMTL